MQWEIQKQYDKRRTKKAISKQYDKRRAKKAISKFFLFHWPDFKIDF